MIKYCGDKYTNELSIIRQATYIKKVNKYSQFSFQFDFNNWNNWTLINPFNSNYLLIFTLLFMSSQNLLPCVWLITAKSINVPSSPLKFYHKLFSTILTAISSWAYNPFRTTVWSYDVKILTFLLYDIYVENHLFSI